MEYIDLANIAALNMGVLLQVPNEISAFMQYVDKTVKPKSFLEIGVCDGGTYYIWSVLCQPGGVKLGIDLPNGPWGATHERTEKEVWSLKHKLETIAPSCSILYEDSKSWQALEWVDEKLSGKLLDFLFIDGDHTKEGVKKDYEIYSRFVKPGGAVAFHDIKDTPKHREVGCTVCDFWKELEGDKIEFIDPDYDWGGIGVIKV